MEIRRVFVLITGVGVMLLGACREASVPVAPQDAEQTAFLSPSFNLQQAPERVMPGRVLARVLPGTGAPEIARTYDLTLEREDPRGAFAVFRGAAGSERALAARLSGDPRIGWAEPDYLREPTEIDPRLWAFRNPGGLFVRFTRGRNSGQAVSSYLSLADADEDNDPEGYGSGGSPVAIASIDTGVQFNHPEFGGVTLEPGWDYYDNDDDPSDTDDHGTHTTGTMVGDHVGVAGVAGAAGVVTVHVYRVCGPLGCPTSAIAAAIRAAADAGVVAMNLSLGGSSLGQAEAEAIAYATSLGALVIASAGNGGTGTVSCPACDPNAISVAASNWQDDLSYYSSWGPGLDLTAPGGELYSNTTPEAGIFSSVRGGGYAYFQGTSMAAPQVTGAAAVVASKTGLTGAGLRAALEGSADDLGDPGYDTRFGHGRLNALAAASYATGGGSGGGGGDPPPPPPLTAAFTYSCSGLTCSFDASGSTGGATSWAWAFGDGSSAFGEPLVTHTYTDIGEYVVVLTVGDGTGTDDASTTIQCTQRGKSFRCR